MMSNRDATGFDLDAMAIVHARSARELALTGSVVVLAIGAHARAAWPTAARRRRSWSWRAAGIPCGNPRGQHRCFVDPAKRRAAITGDDNPDALSELPSVQVARTGAGSELATAAVRGATSAQTPVYLAGVRLNDDVTGTADLSTVPLFLLRRIEVYRGNAPLDADRLGIGGAIFIDPILPRAPRAAAGVGFGSFGALSTWAVGAVGSEQGAGALVAVRERREKRLSLPRR